jgi:hypothetical protein
LEAENNINLIHFKFPYILLSLEIPNLSTIILYNLTHHDK